MYLLNVELNNAEIRTFVRLYRKLVRLSPGIYHVFTFFIPDPVNEFSR